MCGRFALTSPPDVIAAIFRLSDVPQLMPRFNIAPTQSIPAIRQRQDDSQRSLDLLHWGLIPFWAKDRSIGSRMINARAESAAEKPAFRNALKKRRCLVPADGFYEWQKLESGKQPHYIRRADGQPLAFAGMWERWKSDDEVIDSCTILTTMPNDFMKRLHNRMPVILEPVDFSAYLNPDLQDPGELTSLLRPAADGVLTAHKVSTHVNKPANDDPACAEPLAELF